MVTDYNRRWPFLAIMFFALASNPVMTEASTDAGTVVRGFQSVLLSTMKEAGILGYSGRYKRLAPAVNKSHNLALAARITLGRRNWHALSKDQKALFIMIFKQLSISTYADRFDDYNGESFHVVSEQKRPGGNVLVRTLLIKSDGGKVHLDYLMRHSAAGWRIANIIADGVSDLAMKRADYSAVMRKQGFSTLISRLKEKVHDNEVR